MLKVIETKDGSHTLLNTELNETYHSVHGAKQESLHVFIKEGLHYCADQKTDNEIHILEVGFGTGLNALLTLTDKRTAGREKTYVAMEKNPVDMDIIKELNYLEGSSREEVELFYSLHSSGWGHKVRIDKKFTIHKIQAEIQKTQLDANRFDIVYFDAFAPSRQPDIWESKVLEKVILSLKSGGILVTYCARGQLKRDLKALGCTVETLKGAPGKAEMVRATR